MATVTLDPAAPETLGPESLDRLADLVAARLATRWPLGRSRCCRRCRRRPWRQCIRAPCGGRFDRVRWKSRATSGRGRAFEPMRSRRGLPAASRPIACEHRGGVRAVRCRGRRRWAQQVSHPPLVAPQAVQIALHRVPTLSGNRAPSQRQWSRPAPRAERSDEVAATSCATRKLGVARRAAARRPRSSAEAARARSELIAKRFIRSAEASWRSRCIGYLRCSRLRGIRRGRGGTLSRRV